GEWHHFRTLLRGNKMDVIVLLTTFFLTVFFDLVVAIEVGVILSSFLFLKRMSESTSVQDAHILTAYEEQNGEVLFEEELPELPEGVAIYEINGPLFFGASQKFQDILIDLKQLPDVLIL